MKNLLKSLLALLLVFALVACSSTPTEETPEDETPVETPDETPEEPEEPAEEVSQGVTDVEVLVANCAGTSGALSTVGVPFNAGIEAYFNMVNEAGGVNGRTIRFIHQDDEADPALAMACAQSMVEDEGVFAFVGHFYTGSIVATYDYISGKGVPMVYYASGVNTLFNENATGNDRVSFPVQPILITEGQVMVARAVSNFGAEKIGMIYTNDDAGLDMLNGAEAKAAELGIEFVAEQVAAGATDVSAAVTNIMNADVDVVLGASIQGTIPQIISGLATQGNTAPVITSYNNTDAVIAGQIHPSSDGQFEVYASGWIDLTQEGADVELADFVANIDAEHAGSAFATAGWIAGHTFTEGLKAVGEDTLNWENYVDALENHDLKIPFGGYIDFKDGRRVGTDSMTLMKLDMVEGADGAEAPGWVLEQPLQNIEQILGQ
ncbi:MAG TPA: ABC transporter substrate-binding protein [Erysipelothrix sp.]|nr:ABC transporter substrate-binding protein [Erysipelothrix sp.]